MDLGLKGKRVLITGSTSGIGFATAKVFVQEGAAVILNGRSISGVHKAVDALSEEFPKSNISGIVADFNNSQQINALIDELGTLDILINNVGIYTSQSIIETKDEDWDAMFNINVMSGVRLSRAFLPKMLAQNWGRIIFVSSECADIVPTDMIAYSATKAAMHAVSRGLSQMCKASNVTVNTVMPGSTMTEGAEQFLARVAEKEHISVQEAEDNFFKEVRTSSIVQRFLLPAEIAQSIVYLASEKASATNGACLKLDGGSIGGIM